MKTISIKQPWAHLICTGVKDIENRTWATKFRGRVLVHASAKPVTKLPETVLSHKQWISIPTNQRLFLRFNPLPNSAIIGSVEIVDCVINHSSIWAEKTAIPSLGDVLEDIHHIGKAIPPNPLIYNWVLANPILFAKPITNVKGTLSFWEYPLTEESYLNLISVDANEDFKSLPII